MSAPGRVKRKLCSVMATDVPSEPCQNACLSDEDRSMLCMKWSLGRMFPGREGLTA